MSSISGVSSTTNPYQPNYQSAIAQAVNDFSSIGSALQSGNLTGAQTALTAFQQNLQTNSPGSANPATQLFGSKTQANTDYQSLTSALQSGNLSAAQKAFASLQTDLASSSQKTHRHHHHHGSGGTTPSTTTATPDPTSSASDSDGDSDGSRLNVTA